MEMEQIKIEDLKYDEHNFNKHTDKGLSLLEKSITENKFGRSVLVDKDNNIIAGNGVIETARKLGKKKIKVIETDGDELVVVKRKDLDIDSKEGRSLALADNATAAADLEWNFDELKKASEEFGVAMKEWDVKIKEEKETEKLSKLEYKSMYYEPKEIPLIKLSDCFDLSKYKAKIKYLESLSLPKKTKDLLKVFCYRFIRIDFEMIANYYAFKANKEEREAIERLRLVLVDNGVDGFIEDDLLRITGIVTEKGEEIDD